MRDSAIKRAIDLLENDYKVDLSKFVALDMFARDATWQTKHYASKVKKIHAWEVDRSFQNDLVANLPSNAEVCIGDSHELIRQESEIFDLAVLDNPQGCYGANNEYSEHFDALPLVTEKLADESIVIFNVKSKPFNYEDKKEWQNRRNEFYQLEDSSDLSLDFVHRFYRNYFDRKGFDTGFCFSLIRPQESGLYMFVYQLKKRK